MNKVNFAYNLPLSSVSFGQVSYALLKETYNRGLSPCYKPIGGNVDLTAFKQDQDFFNWISSCATKFDKLHNRNNTAIRLWHLSDSLESISKEQCLITFNECDEISQTELNIINNQKVLFVTSNYSKQVMEEYGAKNVKYLELGFDNENFHKLNRKYKQEDEIVLLVAGKWENRKKTERIIKNLIKKGIGNNRKFKVNFAVYNPFFKPEDNQTLIHNALEGKNYWNFNFQSWMRTNAEYNDFINSGDAIISVSGGESRDLPCFHAVGLGKNCLALNAHAYKDYLNNENAVLIEPNGKVRNIDGIFFREGSQYNIGNFYDFNDNDFMDGLDILVKKIESNPINSKGLELQKHTYSNTLDSILKEI